MSETNPKKKDPKLKYRGTSQKLKILLLKDVFEEETDYEHSIDMPQIIQELEKRGIVAERKSIYDDIRVLQDEYDFPIEHGVVLFEPA